MDNNRIPTKRGAVLFDALIAEIQQTLGDNIEWLDHIFGRADRITRQERGRRYTEPSVYRGENDYTLVTPDDKGLGNYAFFTIDDPQTIGDAVGGTYSLKAAFSLIVWCDIRTIPEAEERNGERVKMELLQLLTGGAWFKRGRISVKNIYERAENVFNGFTLDEVDTQYLMHPFIGWRFSGEMSVKRDCAPWNYVPTPSKKDLDNILLENGFALLTEDGGEILLEIAN